MGENKNIKELDAFAKKYIKEIQQEKPSLSFTDSLMDQIATVKIESTHEVKPLISKKGWLFILAIVVAVVSISFQSNGNESLFNFDLAVIEKFQISTIFESFKISITTVYAFLLFGLMIFIQFAYLKNYFHRRFN